MAITEKIELKAALKEAIEELIIEKPELFSRLLEIFFQQNLSSIDGLHSNDLDQKGITDNQLQILIEKNFARYADTLKKLAFLV